MLEQESPNSTERFYQTIKAAVSLKQLDQGLLLQMNLLWCSEVSTVGCLQGEMESAQEC